MSNNFVMKLNNFLGVPKGYTIMLLGLYLENFEYI